MVNQISENQYQEKESTSNYVNTIQRFVTCLSVLNQINYIYFVFQILLYKILRKNLQLNVSLHLKNVPLNERQLYLRRNLIKSNRALENFRPNNPDIKYCKGIILPFKGRLQMVVLIIDTEAQSFNTRKRLSYKLVDETVEWTSMNNVDNNLSIFKSNYQQILKLFQNLMLCILQLKISYKKQRQARQQIINENKKRFDQQFSLKKELIIGRRSYIDQIYTYKQLYEKDFQEMFKQEEKLKHSDKELDNITFLDQIVNEYPNKKVIIEKIQKQLNDSKNFVQQQQEIQQLQSPSQNDLKNGSFSGMIQDKSFNLIFLMDNSNHKI